MESCFTNPTSRCNAAQPRPRRPRCQPFSFTINGTNFDPATVEVLFVGGGCTPCTFSNQFAYHQCRRDLGGSGDIELRTSVEHTPFSKRRRIPQGDRFAGPPSRLVDAPAKKPGL